MKQIKESESYLNSQVTFVMPCFQDNRWQGTVVNHNENLDRLERNFLFSNSNDNSDSSYCLNYCLNYIIDCAEDDYFNDFILAGTKQSQIVFDETEGAYRITLSDGRTGILYAGIPSSEGKEEQIHCLTEEELEIHSRNSLFFRPKNDNINGQTHFYIYYVEEGNTEGYYVPLKPLADRNEQGVTGWYSVPELSIIEKIGTKDEEKERIWKGRVERLEEKMKKTEERRKKQEEEARQKELGLSDNEEPTENELSDRKKRMPSPIVDEAPEEKKIRIEEEREQVQEEQDRPEEVFCNMKKQHTDMEKKTKHRQELFGKCFENYSPERWSDTNREGTSMGQAVYNAATVARKLLEMNGGDKKYQNTYNIAKDFFNTCFKQDGMDIREVAEGGGIDLQESISSEESGIEKRWQKEVKRIVVNSFIDSCFENSDKIGKQNSEETSYRDLFNYTALETNYLIQHSDFGDKQQEKASKIRKHFFKKSLKYMEEISKGEKKQEKELLSYIAESALLFGSYRTEEQQDVVNDFIDTCREFGVDEKIIDNYNTPNKIRGTVNNKQIERNIGIALGEIKPVSENIGNSCYYGGVPQNRNNQHKGRN